MTSLPNPEDLAKALKTYQWQVFPALPGRTNHLGAGVLVPIAWSPRPTVFATLRPMDLSLHGGEICFPGGRPEEGDSSLYETALREAREELAIQDLLFLGRLSSIPLYTTDYRIEPYVVQIANAPLQPNAREVAKVLEIDLEEKILSGEVEGIPYTLDGEELLSPIFRFGEHVMYGATAITLHELLCVVAPTFGASAPTLVKGESQWEDIVVPGAFKDVDPSSRVSDRSDTP